MLSSGVARNLIGGVYVLTSHCNFKKTCVNVPHLNKTFTDFGGIYTDIPPVATPLMLRYRCNPRLDVNYKRSMKH